MLYGIGTDICQISRIKKVLDKHQQRFIQRILTTKEQQIFASINNKNVRQGVSFLASQFAAKEALSKALGLGLRLPMSWQNCAILRLESGKPQVELYNQLLDWCEQKKLTVHISISDEVEYAVGFAIVEQK